MKRILVVGILLLLPVLVFLFRTFPSLPYSIEPIPSPSSDVSTFPTNSDDPEEQLPFQLPDGFRIQRFASDIKGPRDVVFSPGGTLLVSLPGEGRIIALPDNDGNGKSDEIKVIVSGLDTPHGLAFQGSSLLVAQERQLTRFRWEEATRSVNGKETLFDLPSGGRHITRTIAVGTDGDIFVSVGSSCDVCVEKHPYLAAVVHAGKNGENPKLFAKGLRNAVFLAFHPETNRVWATEMGRDFLGDNLPPDEINILEEGKDYGWPYCYGNQIHDTNFDGNGSSSRCNETIAPVFEIPAHSAPLGLTFIHSPQFPESWQGDLLVSYHGSWNRSVPSGYKVVRLDVEGSRVIGAEDFITGFLPASARAASQALGRPVDMAFDTTGALFLSDDKADVMYRITKR